MMIRRRRHWRKKLNEPSFPAKIKSSEFEALINKIVDVARRESLEPKDILFRFNQGFRKKAGASFRTEEIGIIINIYKDNICSLDREDLIQQCYLYLIELWDFYKIKWRNKTKKVFYDFARTFLSRWVGYYVGSEISKHLAQGNIEKSEVIDFEEKEEINLNLGWVFLRSKEGKLKELNIKQKYLLYLRFNKELTNKAISELIGQHIKDVEKEFSNIKTILGE